MKSIAQSGIRQHAPASLQRRIEARLTQSRRRKLFTRQRTWVPGIPGNKLPAAVFFSTAVWNQYSCRAGNWHKVLFSSELKLPDQHSTASARPARKRRHMIIVILAFSRSSCIPQNTYQQARFGQISQAAYMLGGHIFAPERSL